MKRVGVMICGTLFAMGIPMVLILVGFTPHAALFGIRSNLLNGNWEMFLLHFASASLWLIWLYGLLAFVSDLRRLKISDKPPKVSLGIRRWTAMCAATVWSLLVANHSSASASTSNSVDITIKDSESSELSSPTPLALSASTAVVAGILQLVRQRRDKVLRGSAPHSRVQILSHRSQSTLTELQLAVATTNCDDIRIAMEFLMNSKSSPILASWRPNSTPRVVLQRADHTAGAPPLCCVPLGLAQGEIILLTLSHGEIISVKLDGGTGARSVLVHLAHSIVLETLGSAANVIAYGFTDAELINARHLSTADSIEHLVDHVLSVGTLRPTIVCSADPLPMDIAKQLQRAGCCVVTASIELAADVTLVHTQHGWNLNPTQQLIALYGITTQESTAVSRLINEVSRPPTVPSTVGNSATLSEWKIIVHLLGPVEVMTQNGLPIRFEKSKSIELLAWLTTHRSRPSRSAARTALWDVNVQDATFTNVVSDVRRSLGKVAPLTENEEWLARTLTDVLPLHTSVTTDGELLEASIHRASSLDSETALAELRNILEYVRDLPFSGANYLWPDAEGITTQLTLSVMTSAVMASELYLERGDTEGVFWATGRGLKVLPGHEELLALRMRAHALKGDLAAVRAEWSSHQRAIARDVWSGGATSPKLDELCRKLLQQPRHGVYSVSE